LKLVNTIMVNTKGEGEKSSEDFWTKAERLLYCALIGYIWYEAPEEEQNFATLLEFINASETREDDETFKNAVDMLFEELEKEEPEHFAVRQYKKYKLAAGKTAKSILISCGARLAPFDIAELREIMSYDEMELDMVGDQRTALFIIISDTDDTFNFVVAMMYSQLFNLLCDRADDVHHGRLPYHVRILCDEFANIGQIPKFDKLIATIRSREISASIILQSQSQLKTIYKDAAETILGNCDTMLFLGGKESSTLKEISETLGKETIDLYNTSDTRGQSRSYGMNYQKTGKELMSRDELAVMDGSKCILQLRGVRPFFSDKFDITKHKRYKELSDYDKKNEFDVEAYMRHRMEVKLTRTQEFDLYAFSEESLAEELNTENSNDYVRINVISRKIYIDYEEYEIKITNNTQKTILMDGYRKNNSMYLQDSVGGKKTAYTNEIPERLLIINPLLSITRTIKFNKSYTEKISSKGITFEDIILDYDEYKKQENKQEYSNVSNINVGF